MSVDDPDKKPLNQTRHPTATAHANERQMLDSRNDTFGIRTIIKQNADGTETLCRTRAGMPHFETTTSTPTSFPETYSMPLSTRLSGFSIRSRMRSTSMRIAPMIPA